MADGRGSFMFMVPSMLNQVVRHPLAKTLTYPALKVIQIGGAPIADETALMGREVFGDVLYQGFGQTGGSAGMHDGAQRMVFFC